MANTITLDDETLDLLADKIAARIGTASIPSNGTVDKPAKKAAPARKRAAAKEPDPEPDADDEGDEPEMSPEVKKRITALKKKTIGALKKMAADLEFEEEDIEAADKDTLAEEIAFAEAEEEGGADDDDDTADEAEESEPEASDEMTEDDYKGMNLTALRNAAKEAGWTAADVKGQDKDTLIDMLVNPEAYEAEGEEASDDDAEGGEEEWYTEEELGDYSLAELKTICKDNSIKVPRGAKEDALIEAILEAGEPE